MFAKIPFQTYSILLILVCSISATAQEASVVSFNRDIRPILSDRCFACHGPNAESRQADLRLDQAEGPSSAHEVAIVPGSIEESELWQRITSDDDDYRMPPPDSHKPPLTEKEQQIFKHWIETGAKYLRFWAFERPKKPGLPRVKNTGWSQLPIDLFVLQKIESAGMTPSPQSDDRTLIRRLTFDLTGLPPTRAEIKEFLDERQQFGEAAWERLLDRLLARKQYGEHMARYWLDLVRFADTNGMHKDFYRNHVAYRDWVIRAFNENLGYDDMVRYQLAGDLYEDPTDDQLIASGFHRLHLIIDRGTALPEESYFKNVVDRVSAFGTTFMGMTVHCAQCHDHKYDPITQKDFYSLFAFFNNIDAAPETDGRPKYGLQPPFVSFASAEEQMELDRLNQQLADLDENLKLATQRIVNESDPEKKSELANNLKALKQQRNAARGIRDELDRLVPRAMVMKERADVRPTHILMRGQYDAPGVPVERGTPDFLPALKKKSKIASRMDLADWLVDPQHPLTARVEVNRIWQQLFGVGLFKTSEDIGAQGEVPSHPELLDYLAVSFVESGWDIKALVKQIVMSKTYRQSSRATPAQFEKDPENRLLARGTRYRLDAEMIRDQILATSGLLSPKMYGPSVKPPQPDGLWKAVTMIGERFQADTGESIYRRSLYTYWKRGMPPPQMTILNAPNRDACIARRERTNTPTQALLLLNESEYLKAARHLAMKVLEQKPEQRIEFVWEVVTSKLPDDKERAVLSSLVNDLTLQYEQNPSLMEQLCADADSADASKPALAAWTMVVNVLYNLDITKTKE